MAATSISRGGRGVSDEPENLTHRQLIVELAQIGRLPAIYPWREAVEVGGFMAYTFNIVDLFRHAASIIDRILKGAKPARSLFTNLPSSSW